MLDLFLSPLLANDAFQASVQSGQSQVSDTGYFITAIASLVAALVYMVKRNESMIAKFDKERERLYEDQKVLQREGIEAKSRLTSAINEMSLMSRDQHRATMELLSHINAKT